MKPLQTTRSLALLGTLAFGVVLSLPAGCGSTRSSAPVGNGGSTLSGVAVPDAQRPHGIVAFGESHLAGTTESALFVSAAFVADATEPVACTETVEGCTVPKVAVCDGQTGPTCGEGEVCVLDASCQASCGVPCTTQCDADEECFVAASGAEGCRAVARFDAGALVLAGASAPIALAPPYAFEPGDQSPSFLPGTAVRVTAAGSSSGFASFDETVTTTSLIATSLATLAPSAFDGARSVPVTWTKGNDAIVVSVTGPKGMAQCLADDASGHFVIPRAVVNAVLAPGAAAITLGVTRERSDLRVPSAAGSLDIRSSSTETRSFDL